MFFKLFLSPQVRFLYHPTTVKYITRFNPFSQIIFYVRFIHDTLGYVVTISFLIFRLFLYSFTCISCTLNFIVRFLLFSPLFFIKIFLKFFCFFLKYRISFINLYFYCPSIWICSFNFLHKKIHLHYIGEFQNIILIRSSLIP